MGWVRAILAVLAGVIGGGLVISLIQAGNLAIFPLPEGLDTSDRAALAQAIAQMPVGAMIGLELSYAIGCMGAGGIAARVAPDSRWVVAVIVGVVFTALGFVNLATIPTPLWLAILTTATYLPAALAGAWLSGFVGPGTGEGEREDPVTRRV